MNTLEKAARAVYVCLSQDLSANGIANCNEHERETIYEIAREVLMAIRKPARSTILAGDKFHYSVPGAFTAMIDHILNEEQNA